MILCALCAEPNRDDPGVKLQPQPDLVCEVCEWCDGDCGAGCVNPAVRLLSVSVLVNVPSVRPDCEVS